MLLNDYIKSEHPRVKPSVAATKYKIRPVVNDYYLNRKQLLQAIFSNLLRYTSSRRSDGK